MNSDVLANCCKAIDFISRFHLNLQDENRKRNCSFFRVCHLQNRLYLICREWNNYERELSASASDAYSTW